jgi:serine/threonine protein phosphatase PrpC
MPAVGFFSQCGRKHVLNEDRVINTTLAEALGSEGQQAMMSFADMLSMQPEDLDLQEIQFVGVFDGHGGAGCVDFISTNIAHRIAQSIAVGKKKFAHLESAVIDGFKSCEDDFAIQAASQETLDNSGCCALIALLHQNQVLISWVGDCRAILYNGTNAEQLTFDHRPCNAGELKRILDNGGSISNNRVQGVLAPSRCFGDLDIRACTPSGVLIAEPSVIIRDGIDEQAIRKNTAFIIMATDGVWDVFSNEQACDIVAKALKSNGHNAEAAATRLVEEASKWSSDDLTATVCTWNHMPWEKYSGIAVRETWESSDEEREKQ